MRDFRDAKVMAQTLREALNARSVSLTHSESLELIANIFGYRDWNALAARIAFISAPSPAVRKRRDHRHRPARPPANPRVRKLPWLPRSSTATSDSTSSTTTPFLQ